LGESSNGRRIDLGFNAAHVKTEAIGLALKIVAEDWRKAKTNKFALWKGNCDEKSYKAA
jgi:hypothetical protein